MENPYIDVIAYYTGIKEETEQSIKNMHIVLLEELSEHFDKLIFLRKRLRYRFGIYDYLDKNIIPAGHTRFHSYLDKKREIKKAIRQDINKINSLAETLDWSKKKIVKYRKLSEQFESLQCINSEEKIDEIMSKIDPTYFSIKVRCYPA
jgi:hypothetical protein